MPDEVLFQLERRVGHEQMKLEIELHRRMQQFHPDNEIARWANSSQTRFAFSRLMILQRYENTPLRKSDIEKILLVSYQAVGTTVREALGMGIIIEPKRNHYMASDYAWESHLQYLQERFELSSGLRKAFRELQDYTELLSKIGKKRLIKYQTGLYCDKLHYETEYEQEVDNGETQKEN